MADVDGFLCEEAAGCGVELPVRVVDVIGADMEVDAYCVAVLVYCGGFGTHIDAVQGILVCGFVLCCVLVLEVVERNISEGRSVSTKIVGR